MSTESNGNRNRKQAASLEDKVFGNPLGRMSSPAWMNRPEQFLALMIGLVGVALPLTNAGLLCFLLGISAQLAGNNNSFGFMPVTATMMLPFLIITGVNLLLLILGIRQVLARINMLRGKLRESDLMLRILSGWQPELEESNLRILEQRLHRLHPQNSLLARCMLSFTQLPFALGLAQQPYPPSQLPLLIVSFFLFAAFAMPSFLLVSSMGPGSSAGVSIWMILLFFCLACLSADYLVLKGSQPAMESMLLREHLREIDNGVLDIELLAGLTEVADA